MHCMVCNGSCMVILVGKARKKKCEWGGSGVFNGVHVGMLYVRAVVVTNSQRHGRTNCAREVFGRKGGAVKWHVWWVNWVVWVAYPTWEWGMSQGVCQGSKVVLSTN